ncbi:hypothetical protein C5167_047905 [Papaver somniferum]|uniref:Uncharacterized protein n=1 Tax=Papaver somniferum TaxID=3469 RepID=A0A4Y7KKE9_PAPSO|nr:hypothetical protein C5167_047905 [Papaver somniferum]
MQVPSSLLSQHFSASEEKFLTSPDPSDFLQKLTDLHEHYTMNQEEKPFPSSLQIYLYHYVRYKTIFFNLNSKPFFLTISFFIFVVCVVLIVLLIGTKVTL